MAHQLSRGMSKRFYRFESLADQLDTQLVINNPNVWCFEVSFEVANKGKYC